MSDKKTILFNDSFMTSMGGSKTKKNKKPKKEKPIQAVKPNKLKKDLLEKIKKHQQNEKIKKNPNPAETSLKAEDISQEKVVNLDNEEINDPKNFIENNTKQLGISMESKVAEDLVKEIEGIEQVSTNQNDFGLTDLLFVALISLLSGILVALIYIQLNSRKTKKIEYDFDEARDSGSSIQGLPKGLSIENNADEQQFDLAMTYFEMGDLENCKNILTGLIQNTEDEALKSSATNLLEKIKNQ